MQTRGIAYVFNTPEMAIGIKLYFLSLRANTRRALRLKESGTGALSIGSDTNFERGRPQDIEWASGFFALERFSRPT